MGLYTWRSFYKVILWGYILTLLQVSSSILTLAAGQAGCSQLGAKNGFLCSPGLNEKLQEVSIFLRLPSHRALNVCVRSHKLGKACTYTRCSKQTVSTNLRRGIGKKEAFAGIVASSRHPCRLRCV